MRFISLLQTPLLGKGKIKYSFDFKISLIHGAKFKVQKKQPWPIWPSLECCPVRQEVGVRSVPGQGSQAVLLSVALARSLPPPPSSSLPLPLLKSVIFKVHIGSNF